MELESSQVPATSSKVVDVDSKCSSSLAWIATPSSFETTTLAVIVGMHLLGASNALIPPSYIWPLLITAFFGLAIIVVRIAGLAISFGSWSKLRRGPWITVVLLVGMFFVIHLTPWVFAIRFLLVEPEFAHNVERVKLAEANDRHDHTFMIQGGWAYSLATDDRVSIRAFDNGRTIFFRTTNGDAFFPERGDYLDGGVVYSEDPNPDRHMSNTVCTHLYGPWWRYRAGD